MDRGVFITVEGPDGAGKSTHVEFLKNWLLHKNIEVVTTREPGGTLLGESLRNILLDVDEDGDGISYECELLLMFAARMQHMTEVIFPTLEMGQYVLCDRFTDATYAYQGGGRGISEHRIHQLEEWAQRGFQPDLTILFDVPVSVGLQRTKKRGKKGDRFEHQQIQFKEAVRDAYLLRAQKFPERIKLIDAARSITEVQKDLIRYVDTFITAARSPP